ncbi:anthocyanidin 3-O-glucoside 2'''-O-xylosyltransferase [Beta vulgaris subsp. vulgaris]|uniref:anthocyanidin 3-O-glucoside 2'''-O-xylosyltransferase n=1 Tax=Beta vulgaris subsp. vulgaris TaxID=3555 RepID=UPI0020369A49|nr:anthocyanidin 3-O-glucoside 2'''-O-xylosyltransferase [Beta vulgaris subsp. vulgaris]
MEEKQMKVVMYPWFAMGHAIPFMHLANILAEKGHKVTLLLPNKSKLVVESLNLYPSIVTLHTITVPTVHPLPPGTETTSDIPFHLETHLATALDLFRPEFESIIAKLQPNVVFYDFAYWIPEALAASGSKAKCVSYWVVSAAGMAMTVIPFREPSKINENLCIAGGVSVPPGYPMSSSMPIVMDDAKVRSFLYMPYGEGVTFYHRIANSLKGSDTVIVKTYGEIEGKYCDYLSTQYNNKPVLPLLLLPKPKEAKLEPRLAEWLSRFEPGTVVFCAFGSQVVLDVAQFQEILLGFEMTRLPFLVAFKPPTGCATVEEAFPEGFKERVGERGVVTGDWVQQPQILAHPSVGCFVSHCGWGSIWESLMSKNKIVLIPQQPEQVFFSKFLAEELKLVVEVERGEDGTWVSKESLCASVISMMDQDSEISSLIKKNHENLRNKLVDPGFMHGETDRFIKHLKALVIGR